MTYLLFGIKLQLFRVMKGWTQAYAAQKIGMKLKDYQHLEGAQHEPRGGTVLAIQRAFEINFEPEDMTIELTLAEADKIVPRSRA